MILMLRENLRTFRRTIENRGLWLKYKTNEAFSPKEFCKFKCNICGKESNAPLKVIKEREGPSCYNCGSTRRYRSIIAALSIELFGKVVVLPDVNETKHIRGIGMSDALIYATPLSRIFTYVNTFYHKEPKLDILSVKTENINTADFIISSDIFEHVSAPVDNAFRNLFHILKKGGVCIFSVPYVKGGLTKEHYSDLFDYKIIDKMGIKILMNKTFDGVKQQYDNLIFHGGPGATLEMRLFGEVSLFSNIEKAGFTKVRCFDNSIPEYGILMDKNDNSLIITFRKE
ncbi:MAG: hypothetical protein ACYDEX_22525 [Mobilitalea sp.]